MSIRPVDGVHQLELTSSQPDVPPLTIKLDDADLSGVYFRETNIDLESQAWNVRFCKNVMPDGEINNRDCEQ